MNCMGAWPAVDVVTWLRDAKSLRDRFVTRVLDDTHALPPRPPPPPPRCAHRTAVSGSMLLLGFLLTAAGLTNIGESCCMACGQRAKCRSLKTD